MHIQQILGYERGGHGSCKGDSGGPIVKFETSGENVHYVQIGIVQGGIGRCGSRRYPGIYVRLDDPEILDFVPYLLQQSNSI